MNSIEPNKSTRKASMYEKVKLQRAQGVLFIEMALLLPMIAVITFGLAYYGNAYVTKTRLGDSARVIARAIQDDPGISQGNVNNPFGDLGDLERVVAAATGNGEAVPAGFNPASYKSCNPDLAGLSDEMAQSHFARAGRYEGRQGIFGDCGAGGNVAARDVRVNITSYASKPTISQIKAQFPPSSGSTSTSESTEVILPSGKNSTVEYFGWRYANPNTDPSKPYWVSVVAKKPVRQLSLFGWIFGSTLEMVNHAVVRVVPDSNSVTLFQDCQFETSQSGFRATVKPGRYSSMAELGLVDNQISSLRISAGTQVTLYDGENFTGKSITLTADAGCLSEPSQNFNDLASSLVVERAPAKSATLGEPLFAKYTTPYDSSPGRGWTDWNAMLESHFKKRTEWTPASLEAWRLACKSANGGNLSSFLSNSSITFEYCGRFACFEEFGIWPFMARVRDHCPTGGTSDCNNFQFYISWVCLNKAP